MTNEEYEKLRVAVERLTNELEKIFGSNLEGVTLWGSDGDGGLRASFESAAIQEQAEKQGLPKTIDGFVVCRSVAPPARPDF